MLHVANRFISLSLCAGLVVTAACGGKAVIDGTPGSGGSASTSLVSSSASSTGTGVGGCLDSSGCAPTEFCDFDGATCAGTGQCAPRPTACDDGCPGVCGCDGQAYCNACEAQGNGTDAPAPCVGMDVTSARAAYVSGVRMAMTVWEPVSATCFYYGLRSIKGPPFGGVTVDGPGSMETAGAVNAFSKNECFDWEDSVDFTFTGEPITGVIRTKNKQGELDDPVCVIDLDTTVTATGDEVTHVLSNILVEGGPCQ